MSRSFAYGGRDMAESPLRAMTQTRHPTLTGGDPEIKERHRPPPPGASTPLSPAESRRGGPEGWRAAGPSSEPGRRPPWVASAAVAALGRSGSSVLGRSRGRTGGRGGSGAAGAVPPSTPSGCEGTRALRASVGSTEARNGRLARVGRIGRSSREATSALGAFCTFVIPTRERLLSPYPGGNRPEG